MPPLSRCSPAKIGGRRRSTAVARENMPHPIRELGLLIPLTYFLQILRGIILKGVGVEVLWPEVLALAAFGVIVFGLSANRFRKTLD